MKQKIRYDNSNTWLAAQRVFVERKDGRGEGMASPLYQAASNRKVEAIEIYSASRKIGPLSWFNIPKIFGIPTFSFF